MHGGPGSGASSSWPRADIESIRAHLGIDLWLVLGGSWGSTLALATERDGDLAAAYNRLLEHPDPAVRDRAARDWCEWEDAHVAIGRTKRRDSRYDDPAFRMAFARLVTHYWRHAAFIEDGALLRDAPKLSGIPGVLIHGRLDFSSPVDIPLELSKAWAGSRLVIIEDAGHAGTGSSSMTAGIVAATDLFAHA